MLDVGVVAEVQAASGAHVREQATEALAVLAQGGGAQVQRGEVVVVAVDLDGVAEVHAGHAGGLLDDHQVLTLEEGLVRGEAVASIQGGLGGPDLDDLLDD